MPPSKPLTLRAQEVRALLTGRCEVRRAVRPPVSECPCMVPQRGDGFFLIRPVGQDDYVVVAPFGPAGSEVWIRETFRVAAEENENGSYWCMFSATVDDPRSAPWEMDSSEVRMGRIKAGSKVWADRCPKWASRLTSIVRSVTAERTERGWEWVAELERNGKA